MKKIVIAKHGEVRIVRHENIEISGQKIEAKEDIILADSESTGNHHMLQVSRPMRARGLKLGFHNYKP